jgi:Aspartyl protease/PDZ domain
MGMLGRRLLAVILITLSVLTISKAGDSSRSSSAPTDVLERFRSPGDLPFLLVPVSLKGKTYTFCLDTGATVTVFDSSLSSLLGKELPPVEIDTSGGPTTIQCYQYPEARMGRIHLEALSPVLSKDLRRFREKSGLEVFGVIGMDLLKDYVIRVDRDNGEIAFLRSVGKDAGRSVPITYNDESCPCTQITIPGLGRPEAIRLDTGSAGRRTGALRTEIYEWLERAGRMRQSQTRSFVTASGDGTHRIGRLDVMEFVGDRHENQVFAEARETSAVGLNFLSRYVVTFDFPGRTMYVRKGDRFGEPAPDPDLSGLGFVYRAGQVMVESVDKGSPAFDAGLRPGDVVLSVDGVRADRIRLWLLPDSFRTRGKSIRIVVSTAGKEREAIMTLK